MSFVYASVTLYGVPFQELRLPTRLVTLLLRTLQPPCHRNGTGLGYSEFARHYYRNRDFFLFLQVLRWFTSLSSLDPAYVFSGSFPRFAREGFPINACVRLPEAYRSLPRPSSPVSAKASTVRP
jgi:hypothetical protein